MAQDTELQNEQELTHADGSYDEKDIQVLEGLEAVRKRPGMYIGSTGPRGLHHLVYEIVDNSIDEALAGYCTHIEVDVLPGDIISVRDNGRGIPVGMNEKLGLPTVTVVLTVLHAGGKFGGGGYKVAGGLHGVGSSVVNALSEWLEVEIRRDGHIYGQRFERGKTVSDLKLLGDTDETGTLVRFKPDGEIFTETTEFDFETLQKRLRYGKVIIMADADVDGSHICTLLLTFFFRYMRPLIEEGHVYIAQPPLYKVMKGKKFAYAFSDEERDREIAGFGGDVDNVQRYKGLGEMDPQQLWETTMDPSFRTMLKVHMEDAQQADETFSILMGDKVEPRREFIEKNARYVDNLDV